MTFTALKPSLVLPPDHENAGDVIVADIGNPAELIESEEHKLNLIDPQDLPRRTPRIKQGDLRQGSDHRRFARKEWGRRDGRTGGSAGRRRTRDGCHAASVLPIIAETMPELMTEALAETAEGTIANQSISTLVDGKTVLGIGPGLTTFPETSAFVRRID